MEPTVRWTCLAPALVAWVAACGDSGRAPRPDAAASPGTDLAIPPPGPTVDAAAFDSAVEAAGARWDTPRIDLPASLDTGDARPGRPIDVAYDADTRSSDVSLGSCSSELAGTAPFGAALGNGTYIYFPGGRVAGAPAQLGVASPVVAGRYFFGPQVLLADDLSATGLKVAGHDKQVVGDLLPGTGGLAATVTVNAASPGSDVADPRTTSVLLCAAGDVPEPAMELVDTGLSPISTLGINTTTPFTTSGLAAALRFSSPLGPVPIKVSPDPYAGTGYAHGPNYVLAAVTAFPPGQRLTVDASQVRDVLGRPVPFKQDMLGNPVVITVLGTSAVLSDLTFASAPPSGAVAGSGGGTVTNGVLSFARSGSSSGRNVDGLLALPPLSATELRVRIRVGDDVPGWPWCVSDNRSASMEWAAMAVVGPNGESSYRIALSCNGMVDRVLELPKASPLWLAVHVEGVAPTPYYLPPGTAPSVFIDELTPL
jgi:hypothetical protein